MLSSRISRLVVTGPTPSLISFAASFTESIDFSAPQITSSFVLPSILFFVLIFATFILALSRSVAKVSSKNVLFVYVVVCLVTLISVLSILILRTRLSLLVLNLHRSLPLRPNDLLQPLVILAVATPAFWYARQSKLLADSLASQQYSIKTDLEDAKSKSRKLSRRLAASYDHHKRTMGEHDAQLAAKTSYIDLLRHTVDEADALIDEKNIAIGRKDATIAEKKATIQSLEASLLGLRSALTAARSSAQKKDELVAEKDDALKGLRNSLCDTRLDEEKVQTTVKTLMAKIEALEADAIAVRAIVDRKATKIDHLKDDLRLAHNVIAERSAIISRNDATIAGKDAFIAKNEQILKDLKNTLQLSCTREEQCKLMIDEFAATIHKLQQAANNDNATKDAEITELTSAFTQERKQIIVLQSIIADKDIKIAELVVEHTQTRKELEVTSDIRRAGEANSRALVDELNATICNLQEVALNDAATKDAEIAQLINALASEREQVAHLKSLKAEQDSKIAEQHSASTRLSALCQFSEARHAANRKVIELQKGNLEAGKARYEDCSQQLKVQKQAIKALTAKADRLVVLEHELSEKTKQVRRAELENDGLKTAVNTLQAMNSRQLRLLDQQLATLEETNADLEALKNVGNLVHPVTCSQAPAGSQEAGALLGELAAAHEKISHLTRMLEARDKVADVFMDNIQMANADKADLKDKAYMLQVRYDMRGWTLRRRQEELDAARAKILELTSAFNARGKALGFNTRQLMGYEILRPQLVNLIRTQYAAITSYVATIKDLQRQLDATATKDTDNQPSTLLTSSGSAS